MYTFFNKITSRQARKRRIRARLSGTAKCPRLTVYKSNKHLYAQAINDEISRTIVACNDQQLNDKEKKKDLKDVKIPEEVSYKEAFEIGVLLGLKLKQKKIKNLVFDRNGYPYHGKIKALAEGCRHAGISF